MRPWTTLLVALLTGCASYTPPADISGATEIDCPQDMQSQVRLSASAIPLAFPASLNINAGSAEHPSLVARRIMVAVSPTGTARGVKALSSRLTLTTVGGTLAGWASVGHDLAASNAIDVIPGRLRMEPFLRGSAPALKAQTLALDVFVTPGSVPIDEPVISTSALWAADRKPTPPDSLEITLTPVRHLTVFDVVEGTLTLEMTAAVHRPAHEYWRCSFSTRFELIDHESVLPDLWVLRKAGPRRAERRWLVLDDPKTGPFRAIFTDAQAARGFAAWLRTTNADRVGPYQLGLSAVRFLEASPRELQSLEVERLGE
jgi:hypothetical protein